MARIVAGDRSAFDVFVHRHLPAIHAYASRLTGSRHDADDVAQDTFLKVWQKAGSYKAGRVKVSTWLHTIAHNTCIDALRKRKPSEPIEHHEPSSSQGAGDDTHVLERLISRLPVNQRTAVALCLLGGHSTREAAHITGSSPRAVESLISRARRSLREAFREATHEQ